MTLLQHAGSGQTDHASMQSCGWAHQAVDVHKVAAQEGADAGVGDSQHEGQVLVGRDDG